MRIFRHELNFLPVAIMMFVIGISVDFYLRENVGQPCFGCTNITCRIVTLADNPQLFLHDPIGVTKEVLNGEF